jgi:hypothetical protein
MHIHSHLSPLASFIREAEDHVRLYGYGNRFLKPLRYYLDIAEELFQTYEKHRFVAPSLDMLVVPVAGCGVCLYPVSPDGLTTLNHFGVLREVARGGAKELKLGKYIYALPMVIQDSKEPGVYVRTAVEDWNLSDVDDDKKEAK